MREKQAKTNSKLPLYYLSMSSLSDPLLLLPLFTIFVVFSSPAALSAVTITHLPGFTGALPFHLETGYVGVDEVKGVELFYYFIESERNPSEDPLLLWLTGGPGCSAFSGLVFEIGPLKFLNFEYNGSLPTLVYRSYSWTKVSNIIFLDSPVGTGFSFSRDPKGYEVGDLTWSKQVYKFLTKWFIDHPQFLSNPLYIAGDSYAGKVVPVITQEISQGLVSGQRPILNLKGYLVGNSVTGEKVEYESRIPYAHGMGIISDELYRSISRNCEGEDYQDPRNDLCATDLATFNKLSSELWEVHVLEPVCAFASPKPTNMIGNRRSTQENHAEILLPPPVPDRKCRDYVYYLSYYWVNNYATREALHIKKGTVREWVRCNFGLHYTLDIQSSINYHFNVTSRGYRALVYSGDHDLKVPFLGTQAWIRSLNFSIVDDWRSWHVAGQVAGYTRTYSNNLTFATVKGAGHTAPEYKPKQCLAMLDRWISYRPL